MRSLVNPPGAPRPRIDNAWLAQRFGRWLGTGTASEMMRFVDDAETVPLGPSAFGACATYEARRVTFDAGFDYVASGRSGILRGVVPGGPAFRAGLRNNDVFRRRGIMHDPDAPVVVTVYRREGGRTIRFLPRGPAVPIPRYHIVSDDAFRRCAGLPQPR